MNLNEELLEKSAVDVSDYDDIDEDSSMTSASQESPKLIKEDKRIWRENEIGTAPSEAEILNSLTPEDPEDSFPLNSLRSFLTDEELSNELEICNENARVQIRKIGKEFANIICAYYDHLIILYETTEKYMDIRSSVLESQMSVPNDVHKMGKNQIGKHIYLVKKAKILAKRILRNRQILKILYVKLIRRRGNSEKEIDESMPLALSSNDDYLAKFFGQKLRILKSFRPDFWNLHLINDEPLDKNSIDFIELLIKKQKKFGDGVESEISHFCHVVGVLKVENVNFHRSEIINLYHRMLFEADKNEKNDELYHNIMTGGKANQAARKCIYVWNYCLRIMEYLRSMKSTEHLISEHDLKSLQCASTYKYKPKDSCAMMRLYRMFLEPGYVEMVFPESYFEQMFLKKEQLFQEKLHEQENAFENQSFFLCVHQFIHNFISYECCRHKLEMSKSQESDKREENVDPLLQNWKKGVRHAILCISYLRVLNRMREKEMKGPKQLEQTSTSTYMKSYYEKEDVFGSIEDSEEEESPTDSPIHQRFEKNDSTYDEEEMYENDKKFTGQPGHSYYYSNKYKSRSQLTNLSYDSDDDETDDPLGGYSTESWYSSSEEQECDDPFPSPIFPLNNINNPTKSHLEKKQFSHKRKKNTKTRQKKRRSGKSFLSRLPIVFSGIGEEIVFTASDFEDSSSSSDEEKSDIELSSTKKERKRLFKKLKKSRAESEELKKHMNSDDFKFRLKRLDLKGMKKYYKRDHEVIFNNDETRRKFHLKRIKKRKQRPYKKNIINRLFRFQELTLDYPPSGNMKKPLNYRKGANGRYLKLFSEANEVPDLMHLGMKQEMEDDPDSNKIKRRQGVEKLMLWKLFYKSKPRRKMNEETGTWEVSSRFDISIYVLVPEKIASATTKSAKDESFEFLEFLCYLFKYRFMKKYPNYSFDMDFQDWEKDDLFNGENDYTFRMIGTPIKIMKNRMFVELDLTLFKWRNGLFLEAYNDLYRYKKTIFRGNQSMMNLCTDLMNSGLSQLGHSSRPDYLGRAILQRFQVHKEIKELIGDLSKYSDCEEARKLNAKKNYQPSLETRYDRKNKKKNKKNSSEFEKMDINGLKAVITKKDKMSSVSNMELLREDKRDIFKNFVDKNVGNSVLLEAGRRIQSNFYKLEQDLFNHKYCRIDTIIPEMKKKYTDLSQSEQEGLKKRLRSHFCYGNEIHRTMYENFDYFDPDGLFCCIVRPSILTKLDQIPFFSSEVVTKLLELQQDENDVFNDRKKQRQIMKDFVDQHWKREAPGFVKFPDRFLYLLNHYDLLWDRRTFESIFVKEFLVTCKCNIQEYEELRGYYATQALVRVYFVPKLIRMMYNLCSNELYEKMVYIERKMKRKEKKKKKKRKKESRKCENDRNDPSTLSFTEMRVFCNCKQFFGLISNYCVMFGELSNAKVFAHESIREMPGLKKKKKKKEESEDDELLRKLKGPQFDDGWVEQSVLSDFVVSDMLNSFNYMEIYLLFKQNYSYTDNLWKFIKIEQNFVMRVLYKILDEHAQLKPAKPQHFSIGEEEEEEEKEEFLMTQEVHYSRSFFPFVYTKDTLTFLRDRKHTSINFWNDIQFNFTKNQESMIFNSIHLFGLMLMKKVIYRFLSGDLWGSIESMEVFHKFEMLVVDKDELDEDQIFQNCRHEYYLFNSVCLLLHEYYLQDKITIDSLDDHNKQQKKNKKKKKKEEEYEEIYVIGDSQIFPLIHHKFRVSRDPKTQKEEEMKKNKKKQKKCDRKNYRKTVPLFFDKLRITHLLEFSMDRKKIVWEDLVSGITKGKEVMLCLGESDLRDRIMKFRNRDDNDDEIGLLMVTDESTVLDILVSIYIRWIKRWIKILKWKKCIVVPVLPLMNIFEQRIEYQKDETFQRVLEKYNNNNKKKEEINSKEEENEGESDDDDEYEYNVSKNNDTRVKCEVLKGHSFRYIPKFNRRLKREILKLKNDKVVFMDDTKFTKFMIHQKTNEEKKQVSGSLKKEFDLGFGNIVRPSPQFLRFFESRLRKCYLK